jgi:peptidoglycan/LPS O-acetylase OafA/YrhL
MPFASPAADHRVHGGAGASRPHFEQLDALRALAVAAVLVSHYFPRELWLGADVLGEGAAAGVRLFFALSGFLITSILLETRERIRTGRLTSAAALAKFYVRRVLRIFPLYFLVLGVCWLLGVTEVRDHPWSFITFTYNMHLVRQGWYDGYLGHFWSLSVEQQFYLLWPFIVLFAPTRLVGPAAWVAMAGAELARFYYSYHDPTGMASWVSTPASCDALAVGALVALAARQASAASLASRRALSGWTLVVCGLALCTSPWWEPPLDARIGYAASVVHDVAELATYAGLLFGAQRRFGGLPGVALSWRPMAYIGTISYGLYVYHPLMLPVSSALLGAVAGVATVDAVLPRAIGALALSVGAAALSWRCLEKPINDLKRFF